MKLQCTVLAAVSFGVSVAFSQVSVANAAEVTRLIARKFCQNFEYIFRRRPLLEHLSATPILGNQLDNVKVGKCLPRRAGDFLNKADPAL